jgi:hypothetical protein
MSSWVTVTLPIGTLVLGSVLTMTGQALNDRRAAKREERGRREQFLASNFEMHRTAMLEMLELASEFYQAWVKEKTRREIEFYQQIRPPQAFREASAEFSQTAPDLLAYGRSLTRPASEEEANEIALQLERKTKAAAAATQEYSEQFTKYTVVAESLFPFWRQYSDYTYKLRLCEMRSGSNSVVETAEAFLDAVYKWNDYYKEGEKLDALVEAVRSSRRELDRALANALAEGPYDKYRPGDTG